MGVCWGEAGVETPSRAPTQPPERGGVPRQHRRPACPSGPPRTFRSQCPLEQLSRTRVLDLGQTLDRGLSSRPSPAALSASTGDCAAPEDEPPPALSSRSSSTDDFCYMFVVELERGPSGLGMGLIDGMVSGRPVRPGLLSTGQAHSRGGHEVGGGQRPWGPGPDHLLGLEGWGWGDGQGLPPAPSASGICPGPWPQW